MTHPVIAISPDAAARLLIDLTDASGSVRALRISIDGAVRGQFTYDLEAVDREEGGDHVFNAHGLSVAIPSSDVSSLEGAQLEVRDDRLVMINHNRPRPAARDGLIYDDSLGAEIMNVIRDRINPNLDAHGGTVAFIGHDGLGSVHLQMEGGCQGCAMAESTMFDGIERVLRNEIPSVLRVVDATDHANGMSPYYR